MRITSWRPNFLLSLFGSKDHGQVGLEMVESWQPSLGVDVSRLVPPLMPPTAWVGAEHTSTAARNTLIQFVAGPTGGWVRRAILSNAGGVNQWIWAIVDGPVLDTSAAGPVTEPPMQNMSARGDVRMRAYWGSWVAIGTALPSFRNIHSGGVEAQPVVVDLDIYLAPGRVLQLLYGAVTQTTFTGFLVQDAVDAEPRP